MVLAAAIVPFGVRESWAQSHAPDPRMLLDLDLFAPNPNAESGPEQDSMLERIRTLRAMGYLNRDVSMPQQPAVIDQPAPPPQAAPPPPAPKAAPPPDDTEDEVTE